MLSRLADAVVAAGHMLVATARNPAQLADLAQHASDRIRTVALDVTDATAAERAIQTAREAFGRLDVLVNNAGYGNINSIEETSLADFREQIETNLFGVVNVTKARNPAAARRTRVGAHHPDFVESAGVFSYARPRGVCRRQGRRRRFLRGAGEGNRSAGD